MITTQQKQALCFLGFTHIAWDIDGDGGAFWSKPVIKGEHGWFPVDNFEDFLPLESVNIIGDNGKPWRESLEEL